MFAFMVLIHASHCISSKLVNQAHCCSQMLQKISVLTWVRQLYLQPR
uniref:Methylcrotonoyl-CoA carboxylase subunit alpha isoform X2 n=1 Tax=Rhizophora mucronata TaxID=61149 RepID=A0A2P2MDL6_RHIMU